MGIASALASGKSFQDDREHASVSWNDVFGHVSTDRHEAYKQPPVRGGSWGRSVLGHGGSQDIAQKRLLQALRSMAPGGWSDDRWEQGSGRHFTGVAYMAIHRICTQWQRAEFQVFKKDPKHQDGKRPITKDDPPEGDRMVRPYHLVRVLERPNKQDSFGKYMYRLGQQKYLTGTSLTWMVPSKLDAPMELYSIPTAIAIPQPAVNPDFPDGYYRIQPVYPYGPFSSYPSPSSAVGAAVPAQWMMRFQFPHPLLRYDGFSPLTALRQNIDTFEMIDRSRHYKMRRSFNPNLVLDFSEMEGAQPFPEAELERMRAEIESAHQGPENNGNLFVPPPGAKLTEMGATPREMDYQSGWTQQLEFILAALGITKPAAGMVDTTAYAQLFAALKQLYWLTLEPDMEDVGSEFTHHLAPFYGDDLIVEVRCKRIDDQEQMLGLLNVAIQAKAITKNQVLRKLDFPMTKEPWGDEIAGFEAPPEQPGMPGMPGMEGGMPGQGGLQEGLEQNKQEIAGQLGEVPEENPLDQTAPTPGPLNQGSLGPRMKSLQQKPRPKVKSFYDSMMKAMGNGNGDH